MHTDETPKGFFEISPPGPFKACSYTTITLTYTVGLEGLVPGSVVKFALPNNGWGEPLTPYPRGCPELYKGEKRLIAGWSRCNTTVEVKSKQNGELNLHHRNSQNVIGKYDNWSWWITAVIEAGTLTEGDRIIVTYGDTRFGENGAFVQPWAERERVYFSAFVDSKGDGGFVEVPGSPVACSVVPGEVDRCAMTIPSVIRPDQPYKLKLALTDWGHDPVSDLQVTKTRLLDNEGKAISTPLLFQRASQDRVEGLRSRADARYSIEVRSGESRDVTGQSNPAVCRSEGLNLYWGDLHCHSFYHMFNPKLGYGHPCTSPEELIQYARDVSHLDFVALTDGRGALPDNIGWEESQKAVIGNYQEGELVTLKGWEVQFGLDGHRNVIYREAEIEPHIEAEGFQAASVWSSAGTKGMWSALEYYQGRKDVMLIPHHPMAWMNWDVHDPELDRLVEIYSCWGSSEHRHNELWSKSSPEKRSVRYALSLGYKLGFVGGSDSHTGYVGRSVPDGDRYKFVPSKAGLTAVWTDLLSRHSIYDALRARRCYATTGERIIVEFWVDGHFMGEVIPAERKRDGHTVRFMILGSDVIRRVEVIRDGEIAHTSSPNQETAAEEWEDWSDQGRKASYYYLKAVQADGNVAWASPVWV